MKHTKPKRRNTHNKTPQDREDARDIATAKRILRSPTNGKLISESRVLKDLGYAIEVHR